jgi:hypothetical protein
MAVCRPVYPGPCLDAIEAAGNTPRKLADAIADKLKNDQGLQQFILAKTGAQAPYDPVTLNNILRNPDVRDEIIKRTSDVYFSLTKPPH